MIAPLVKLLIVAVLVVVAVLLWRGWQDRKASPGWPSVMGTITRSDIRPEHNDPYQEYRPNAWVLDLRYTYQVQGETYEGERVRALPYRYTSEEAARAALAPYPVGARVPVYHDPARPRSSVLQPG